MNVKKLSGCMELLKNDVGDGLIDASILSLTDDQPLVTVGTVKSGASSMSCELTKMLKKTLALGYPPLRRFYYVDLEGDVGVLVIPMDDYQWAIAVNTEKTKLGLILNVVLPKLLEAFGNAIKSE